MCAFQRFEAFGTRQGARVSIRSNGQFGLSAGCLKMFGINGEGWKVELFYDPDTRMVGMKPTQDQAAEYAVPLLVREGKVNGKLTGVFSGNISGKSFLENYQIKYKEKTRAFDPTWDEANKLFVIDMKKERQSRKKKKDDPPVS